jgi:rubrerythrin
VITVKAGDIRRTVPWFLSRVWVCPHCGCEFQPEDPREVRLWSGHQLEPSDPDQFGAADCPTCGKIVSTRDDREEYW